MASASSATPVKKRKNDHVCAPQNVATPQRAPRAVGPPPRLREHDFLGSPTRWNDHNEDIDLLEQQEREMETEDYDGPQPPDEEEFIEPPSQAAGVSPDRPPLRRPRQRPAGPRRPAEPSNVDPPAEPSENGEPAPNGPRPLKFELSAQRLQGILRKYVRRHTKDYSKVRIPKDCNAHTAMASKIVGGFSKKDKIRVMQKAVHDKDFPMTDFERNGIMARLAFSGAGRENVKYDFNGTHVMLTYNPAEWSWMLPTCQGKKLTSMDDLVDYCKGSPWVQKLVEATEKDVAVIVEALQPVMWAWSMEICPQTLKQEEGLRLHIHVVLAWKQRQHIRTMGQYKVGGVAPGDISRSEHSERSKVTKRRQTAEPLLYYVSMPKIGQVHHMANHAPHVDYDVNPRYVTQWVGRGKMSWENAEKQYVHCCGNLRNNLGNLTLYKEKKREMTAREKRRKICAEIALKKVDFIRVEPLEAFQMQFQTSQDRTYPLVLDGGSNTGKTYWARWCMGNPDNALVVNCTKDTEPDHRQFIEGEHVVIVYEECTPTLMAKFRKIFQAPAFPLTMGQSATGMYSYQRFLNGTRMIITANAWEEQLQELEKQGGTFCDDAKWVRSNTFHVFVHRPLFYRPEDKPTPATDITVTFHPHAVRNPGPDAKPVTWGRRSPKESGKGTGGEHSSTAG